jgi:predicted Fe-S protein YdhL (DUF1289 family)
VATPDKPPSPRSSIPPGDVASPCISVCVLLEAQGICAGCCRTLDEIAQWSVLDAPGRRAVLAALPARRLALGHSQTPMRTNADADC